jgi:hypothetical protein
MSVNVPTIADVLVNSNHQFRKEVMAMPLASIDEWAKHVRIINNLKGKETESVVHPGAHFRPYNAEGAATGTATLKARTLETLPVEILEEFDPEAFYTTIFGEPVNAEKIDLPIVKRLLTEEMRSACRGLCDVAAVGDYNSEGTGNLDCSDGFDTIIKDEKTAGNITLAKGNFMTLGTVSEYNIGDKWSLMYKRLNESLRGDSKTKLQLICSFREKEMYNTWYAAKFGHGNFAGVPTQQYLHGTDNKVEIVALPGMDAADHCFITTKDNMKIGLDTMPNDTRFEINKVDNPHLVQMYVKMYFGCQFVSIDKEFLFAASRVVKSDDVYMVASADEIVFDDTALSASDTETITLFGFNLTSASTVSVEGTNAGMFSSSAASISADDGNATAGKTLTLTFSPTTSAGDKTAVLHIKNTTDDVDLRITLKGKGTNS